MGACAPDAIIAWSIQLISTALILLGIGLAALWAMPPFWTPYVYALLFVLISVRQLIQRAGSGDISFTASRINAIVIS